MDASIIICTYNRSDCIKNVLLSLCNQKTTSSYEIIVVDNNSTDNTKNEIIKFSANFSVEIRYHLETNQGLSFARNRGVEASLGEVVLFIDDDAVAEKSWLETHVSAYSDRDVFCAGGPIRPVWPFPKPEWIKGDLLGYLSVNEFETAVKKKHNPLAFLSMNANMFKQTNRRNNILDDNYKHLK